MTITTNQIYPKITSLKQHKTRLDKLKRNKNTKY